MNPRYGILCLVAVLCSLVSSVAGQVNVTTHYTVADGLPFMEVTKVHTDRAGRIWTAHTSGDLVAFDGRSFTVYPPQVTGIRPPGQHFTDDRRGMWVLQNPEAITLFRDGRWKAFPAKGIQLIKTDAGPDEMVGIDTAGRILTLDTASGAWTQRSNVPGVIRDGHFQVIQSPWSSEYLVLTIDGADHFKATGAFSTTSLITPAWRERKDLMTTSTAWEIIARWFGIRQALMPLEQASLFSPRRRGAFIITKDAVLTYTSTPMPGRRKNRIDIYRGLPNGSIERLATTTSPERTMNLALDRTGGIWIGSIDGLYRVDPARLILTEDMDHMPISLHCLNEDAAGNIWFGGYTGGLARFDGRSLHPGPPSMDHVTDFYPGSWRDARGNMAFWTERHGLVTYSGGQWKTSGTLESGTSYMSGFFFHTLQDGRVAAGMLDRGLGITTAPPASAGAWTFIGPEKGMRLGNVLTIAEDLRGRLWMGRGSRGVAVYDPKSDTARTWLVNEPKDSLSFGMLSSAIDPQGRLWMGCSDGIRVIDDPAAFDFLESNPVRVARKINLPEIDGGMITLLHVFRHYLVYGNTRGYGFLDLNGFDNKTANPPVYYFPTARAGGGAEQNAVLTDRNGFLWIGLDRAALRIDPNKLQFDTVKVRLIADRIAIKGYPEDTVIVLNGLDQVNLPRHRRSGTLHLSTTMSPYLMDNVRIEYRFLDRQAEDTTWTDNGRAMTIRFDILPAGANLLEVRALKNNREQDRIRLTILVPRSLEESGLFWALLATAIGLAGFFMTRHELKNRIRLQAVEIKLSEQVRERQQFQIQALANSLNPHFIKNTLNWIQTRFNKDKEAVDVINRLSENIGTVFKHSRNGEAFHSLEDEMRLTENYLAIQRTNYGAFFSLEFPTPEAIRQWGHLVVPLLQVQIHVENAIEHGLRPRIGDRRLSIRFEEHARHLHIVITDNGIGREAARLKGRRSTGEGLRLLGNIYDIYNPVNADPFEQTYEDLVDPVSGQPTGTRVVIRVPKNYQTQLP